MLLRGAGYTVVKHVVQGMFTWRNLGLPTEEDVTLRDMPAAKDVPEEALLRRLGYDAQGVPHTKEATNGSSSEDDRPSDSSRTPSTSPTRTPSPVVA